jgi:hypothetical protein
MVEFIIIVNVAKHALFTKKYILVKNIHFIQEAHVSLHDQCGSTTAGVSTETCCCFCVRAIIFGIRFIPVVIHFHVGDRYMGIAPHFSLLPVNERLSN